MAIATRRSMPEDRFTTSLGPVATRHGGLWSIDLTELPLLHGLSVLSRALGELVLDQARDERIDLVVERRVTARENPELLHVLGVTVVKVCAEHETIASIADHPEEFQDHLRALLGTLQRKVYREALFAPAGAESRALVFTFEFNGSGRARTCRFVLERLGLSRTPGKCCLRVTIEDAEGRQLDLASIPHVQVDRAVLAGRTFIAGSTRIAQTWREGVRREAERGRRGFSEVKKPYVHVFAQLAKAGLAAIEQINITWSDAFVPRILEGDPSALDHLLKRVLLALEDREMRRVLSAGEIVRVVGDDTSVYLDQSQLGRVLSLSLGQRRTRLDVGAFLRRMPATGRVVQANGGQPLAGVKVFLIHHMTAEVVGLIAGLRELGCRDLVTLFVAYAGEAPGSYLGPLLDLPATECRFLALANVPDEESVEGRYKLSGQYSTIESAPLISAVLGRRRRRYLEAMQAAALIEFMRQLRGCGPGERCLVVEDGGYLAPLLNRALLEDRTVREFVREWDPECTDERPLRALVEGVVVGSVEHTRNGHNRLAAVESEYGTLALPAFSIAVSRLKRDEEAREVAVSILNAVENVLNASGRILSRRRCLIIGSRGAIGARLVDALGARLNEGTAHLCGVDLEAGPDVPGGCCERDSYRRLPEAMRRGLDLMIGVAGASVLRGSDVEEWLLTGERDELTLVSGSTKTEEFADVSAWLDELLRAPTARVGGRSVQLAIETITDPITGRTFGHRCRFTIGNGPAPRARDLVLLANLTPANFMFYGVPTEVIDEVIAQLLSCTLGLVRRAVAGTLARRLCAVDRDITPEGAPLAPRPQFTSIIQSSGFTDPSSTATWNTIRRPSRSQS